jgi:hypothetical protein
LYFADLHEARKKRRGKMNSLKEYRKKKRAGADVILPKDGHNLGIKQKR